MMHCTLCRAGSVRASATATLLLTAMYVCLTVGPSLPPAMGAEAPLRAGASAVDITPEKLPVIVSGMFLEGTSNTIHSRLYARCLVLESGQKRVALVVVDTLMMPRQLLDRAKQLAQQATGIPAEHMMISATHTHSAPSVMGALGSGVQEDYAAALPEKLAEAVRLANQRLVPAQVGWATIDVPELTHCRRWLRRPDRIGIDPFGERTIRAMMHPGYQNPDYICPAGPVDSALSLLAVQTSSGSPLAVLCNYSMHYFGAPAVSADYFGLFCEKLAELIAAEQQASPQATAGGQPQPAPAGRPVVMISQGTSGDLHWMDYSQPRKSISISQYADTLVAKALAAYKTVKYHRDVPVDVLERTLTLRRRTPDEKRLAWAKQIVSGMIEPGDTGKPQAPRSGREQNAPSPKENPPKENPKETQLDLSQFPQGLRKPRNQQEVYALEQIYLHLQPERELKLQVIRIGQLGIAAIPCEVFGITGLKLKAQSPLVPLMNIELANGAEGYIPPPEQHLLGGYTTWPARTAALEVQAEPKIVQTLLEMLEQLAGANRRPPADAANPYVKDVRAAKPLLYWQLGDWSGPQVADSSAHGHHGTLSGPHALALPGVDLPGFSGPGASRAVYFAGGCARTHIPKLPKTYSAELWFWNGLPLDAESRTACLLEIRLGAKPDTAATPSTAQPARAVQHRLCLMQTKDKDCRLALEVAPGGPDSRTPGRSPLAVKTWNHVALVCDGISLTVYLNGRHEPELAVPLTAALPDAEAELILGNSGDGQQPFEGKIDELAVYDRALPAEEIARHYQAAAEVTTSEQTPWMELFDGRSLAGWKAAEGAEAFAISDGAIVIDGPPGCIYYVGTEREPAQLESFELQAEVLTHPAAAASLHFHTSYQPTGVPKHGFEVLLRNSVPSAVRRPLPLSGSLTGIRNIFVPTAKDMKWFPIWLRVSGGRVQITVDGKLVVDYVQPANWADCGLPQLRSGTIALRSYGPGNKVLLRNLRLKHLPPQSPQRPGLVLDETDRRILKLQQKQFPLVDMHVHAKGGLTLEEALRRARSSGINYGVAVNCGLGFPVTDDKGIEEYLKSTAGLPIFVGMQAEGREWPKLFSRQAVARFDYVFTDAMTIIDHRGQRARLWIPAEVDIPDPQQFIERLVRTTVEIIENEPIDIYVNPTYLPEKLARQYDQLWTAERLQQVVAAAVRNNVAIEINSKLRLPKPEMIKMAKHAGVKFTFGTNNAGANDLGRLEYCLEMIELCGLTPEDIWVPQPRARTAPKPLPDNPGNVFLEGQEVTITLPGDKQLAWRAVDYDGKTVAEGRGGGKIALGKLPIGYYELQYDGQPADRPPLGLAVLAPLRVPTPASSSISCDVAMAWFYPPERMPTVANLCSLAGLNWVRDRLNWAEVEPVRGQLAGRGKYDTAAQAQSEAGLRVLQVNHISPAWANPNGKRFPLDLRDAYRFYRSMARRWRTAVAAFEPWNEADIPQFGGHTGAEIASFQKAAYLGLKAGNPRIIACQNVFAVAQPAILEDFHANRPWPYFDTFNLHHYAPVEQYGQIYERFRAVSAGRPLWVTECNVPVRWSGSPDLQEPSAEDLRVQAERVAKVFAGSLHQGAEQVFYFLLPHYVEGQTQFGVLRRDLTPRPAFVALAAVGHLLADAQPLGQLAGQPGEVWAFAFRASPNGQPKAVLVAWSEGVLQRLALPVAPQAVFNHLGRPLIVPADGVLEVARAPVFVLLPVDAARRLQLRKAPPKAPPSEGQPCPVVLQAVWPEKQVDLKNSAYKLAAGKSQAIPVYVYNFSHLTATGSMAATGQAGWKVSLSEIAGAQGSEIAGAQGKVQIAPGERIELTLNVQPPADRSTQPAVVNIEGDFGAAGKAVLSLRLLAEL